MSKQIEERVVEMRFDNEQFEKNVSTTLSSLGKLKKSLKLKGAEKGLQDVDRAARRVDLSSLERGVAFLEKRFSTLGIVGMRAIERITDSMMNLGKKATSFITEGVVQGGIRRATNIENARFMLQGLLKDEAKVVAVMDNAMESVDGTAYAFDEAAKAAAQFAASGIEAGDRMKSALRGITGVAAVGNAEYSEIAHIFNTISGNGRVMGEQLNQISVRGINAASTMAEFFKKVNDGSAKATEEVKEYVRALTGGVNDVSESQIRDWVTKKKITADVFFAAMDDSFGDQAKKANETFNGALANVKSALARIGAEFVAPLIEQNGPLVGILNTLREKINDVKKALAWDEEAAAIQGLNKEYKSFIPSVEKAFELLKKDVSEGGHGGIVTEEFLNSLRNGTKDAGEVVAEFIDGVGNHTKVASAEVKEAIQTLQNEKIYEVFQKLSRLDLSKSGLENFDVLTKINRLERETYGNNETVATLEDIVKWIDEGKLSVEEFGNEVKITGEDIHNFAHSGKLDIDLFQSAMADTFGDKTLAKKFTDSITLMAERFNAWLETADGKAFGHNLSAGLEGVLNIFKAIGSYIKPVVSAFAEVFFGSEKLRALADGFRDFTAKLKLSEEASENLKNTFKGLFAIFDIIGKVIGGIIKAFFPAFGAGLKAAGGGVLAFTGNIGEMIYNFDKMLTESGKFQEIGEKVKSVFTAIGEAIKAGIEKIKSFFGLFKKDNTVSSPIEKIGKSFKAISTEVNDVTRSAKALTEVKTMTLDSAKGMTTAADQTTGALDEIKNSLTIDWEKVGKYGMVGVLSLVAVKVFKLVKGIAQTVKNFMNNGILGQLFFGNRIGEVFHSTSEAINAFAMQTKADALGKVARTILLLAGGLALLTLLDPTKLAKSLGIVSGLFADLTISMTVLMHAMKKLQSSSRRTSDKGILGVLKESLGNLTRGAKDAMFIASISGMMVALAGSILMLAGAVAILSKAENLGPGLAAVSLLFGEVAALIITVQMINKKVKGGDAQGEFFTMSLAILSIAVCVKALASVVKSLSKLNPRRLKQGLLAFTGIMAAMAGTMLALHFFKFDWKQGTTILLFCFSLMKIFKVVKKFSDMRWSELKRGLAGALAAIGMLVGVIFAMSMINRFIDKDSGETNILENKFIQMAAAMLIVANGCAVIASAIKKLGKFKPAQIAQGVIALSVAIGVMATALTLMSRLSSQNRAGLKNGVFGIEKSNILQAAGAMLILAAALDILTPAILALGLAAPVAMGGVIVIGALLAAFTGIAKLVSVLKLADEMFVIASAIALIGASCLAVTAGIFLFIASIEKLANIGALTITKFLINLELLLGGIATVVASLVPIFVTALFNFINLSLKQLKTVIPQIAESLAQMAYATIDALAKYGPQIANRLFDFLNGVLKVVAKRAPEFIETLAEAFHGIFTGLGKVLSTDTGKFAELVGGVTTLAGAMFLFSKIKLSMIGAAVKGVLAFGVFFSVFILVIGGILAAVGELENLINAAPAIEKGGEVLEAIGNALGKGIGGFIGGVVEGASDSLPEIADNVTKFIKNLEPAIEGFKLFADEESGIRAGLESMNNLLVVLSGTELADAYAQATTFGHEKDISYIGAMLADFGASIAVFYENINKVDDIDLDKLKGFSEAGVMLSLMIDKVPKTGGINTIFEGVKDTAGLADGLTSMANAIKAFYNASKDIDEGMSKHVTVVAKAAKAIVDVAAAIPNSGGILEDWMGNNDIDKFGQKLNDFGKGIKEFNDWGAQITIKYINRITTAAKAIVGIANDIPNSGGLWGILAGDNKPDEFGKMLYHFGKGINDFSYWGSQITLKYVNRACAAASKIAEVAKEIPNSVTLIGGLGVTENIQSFGEKLAAFGHSLKDFSDTGATIDAKGFRKAYNHTIKMLGISQYIDSFDVFKGMDQFVNNVGPLGEGIAEYGEAINRAKLDSGKANQASYILGSLTSMIATLSDEGIKKLNSADLENFAAGVTPLGAAINSYCNSVDFITGSNLNKVRLSLNAVDVLTDIMDMIPSSGTLYEIISGSLPIENFATEIANFGAGLKQYGDSVQGLDSSAVASSRYAAMTIMEIFQNAPDFSTISQSTGLGSGTLETFSYQLGAFGTALKTYGDNVEGLKTGNVTNSRVAVIAVMEMLNAMGDATTLSTYTTGDGSLSSFGEHLETFGTHLLAFSNSAASVETSKINPLATSMKLMMDTMVLAVDKDAQPLVDLTKTLGQIDTNGVNSFLECFNDETVTKFVSTAQALGPGLTALFTAFQNAPDFAAIAGTGLGVGNMATFSQMLPAFGGALKDYVSKIEGIGDVTAVANSATGIAGLMEVVRAIGTADDLIALTSGDVTIEDLGVQLSVFGENLLLFSGYAAEIKTSKINPLATSLHLMMVAAEEATIVSAQSLVDFTNTLNNVSEEGVDSFIRAFQNVDEAIRAIRHFISALTLGVDDSQVHNDLLKAAGDLVTNLASAISEIIGNEGVANSLRTLITPIAQYMAEGIAEHLSDSANTGIIEEALIEALRGMTGRDPIISEVQDAFHDVGEHIVNGVWAGIDGKWPELKKHWEEVITGLLTTARAILDEHSPSKEFIKIAKFMMQGMTVGITKNKKSTQKALKDALQHLIIDAKSMGNKALKTLSFAPDAITEYLKSYKSISKYAGDAISTYNKIFGSSGKVALEGFIDSLYKQSDAYKESKKALKEYYKEAKIADAEARAGVEGAADKITELRGKIAEETKKMAQDRKAVYKEYVKSVQDSIKSAMDIYSEVSSGERVSTTKLLDNMKSQYERVQKWADNIRILASRGVSQAMIQDLISRGVGEASTVETLVKMTADQLAEAQKYFVDQASFQKSTTEQLVASAAKAGEAEATAYADALAKTTKKKKKKKTGKGKSKAKKKTTTYEESINYIGPDITQSTVEVEVPVQITYSLEEVENQVNDALDASEKRFLSYSHVTSDAVEFISNRLGTSIGLFASFASHFQRIGNTAPMEAAKTALEEYGAVLLRDTDEYRNYIQEFDRLSAILSNPQLDPEDFKEAQKQLDELNKNWSQSCVKAVQDVYDSVVDSAKNALSVFNANLNTGSSAMSERTVNSLKEDAKQIVDIFSSTAKTSVDIFTKYSAGSSVSKKSLLKIMAGQIAGVQKYEDMLGELAGTSISEGLYNSIKDMGTEGQGYIKAFLKMSESEIAEANANFEKQGKMNAQAYLQAIKDDIANANRVSESLETLLDRGLSKDIYDKLKEQGVDAAETINKLIYLDSKEIEEINALFIKAQNGGKTASEKVLSNMQDQIDAAEEWERNLTDLARRGIDEGLLSQLRNMGPESAEYVKAFVEMTAVELGKANVLYKKQMVTNSNTILTSARRNLEDVKTWAKNMNSLAARGISTALYTELAKQGVDGRETVAAIASMTNDELSELSSLYKQMEEVPNAVANSIMTGLATNLTSSNFAYIPQNIAAGINSTMPQALGTANALASGICNNLNSELNTEALQMIGSTICTGIQNGVLNGQESTISKCTELAKYILAEFKLRLSADTFYNVGLDVDKGLAKGINNTSPKSVTSATKLAKKVLKQLKKAFNINSPSKETEDMGMYLDEGLAHGLVKYLSVVKYASEEVTDGLVSNINDGIYQVMDMANIDLNPVIRPTLDLSQVEAEAGKIKNILDYTEQLNVTLDGLKNDDVVDAIGDIRADFQDQFDKLSDSIAQMQLVMDTGSLVGAIAGPMDKEMGRLASFQRRGMI